MNAATKSLQYEIAEALVACGHSRGDAVKKVRALVDEAERRVTQSAKAVRRDAIAGPVMAGLISANIYTAPSAAAKKAVEYADALLKELDK